MSEQALDFHLQMADDHEQQLFERQQELDWGEKFDFLRPEVIEIGYEMDSIPDFGEALRIWSERHNVKIDEIPTYHAQIARQEFINEFEIY